MKFAQVEKGTLARKRVSFPTNAGVLCECDVRVMSVAEVEQVLKRAISRTKELGAEPKHGDVEFDLALATETVADCCVDAAVTDKLERYFVDTAEVRDNLDPDRVFYLYEQQRELQRETAPLKSDLSKEEFAQSLIDAAKAATGGDDDPFWLSFTSWQPSLRRTWCRTLAGQWLTSLTISLRSGTADSATPPSDAAPTSGS